MWVPQKSAAAPLAKACLGQAAHLTWRATPIETGWSRAASTTRQAAFCRSPVCRWTAKTFFLLRGASMAMSNGSAESQLQKLKIELPPAPAGVGAYVGVVRTGNLVVTSGQLPWQGDKFLYSGKVGAELTLEEGYAAARQCAHQRHGSAQIGRGRLGKGSPDRARRGICPLRAGLSQASAGAQRRLGIVEPAFLASVGGIPASRWASPTCRSMLPFKSSFGLKCSERKTCYAASRNHSSGGHAADGR